ncbi:2-C-methyl-D-erythritol 2,4-cyclodiphosphate synthase [Haloplasma contractile]|uniref:2-C-methyl-D-erythritol 2,4-cyclodiphosphate synthase n=1 Tax=Haloplasma contractile SSD-17B TaxID=1033810 RepID=U2DVM2_9MOLU|nr:2-C-methyl-D-erythritol 2,4-cyclodiphosphate synthase [Haloplasma contractile]ERJ12417.1 2-C-methyl-D-erythritol 24-cyclodiphosphate synthase protein [Haloplasma contractile SSD-17B]
MNFRIGHSTDIHRLVDNRDLILGGVKIDHEKGLLGHSDADALLHAITEAIIGALGKGDIGTHFPDTSSEFKDVDSKILLKNTMKLMIDEGYRINNIDSTIFAERPKMKPHIESMKQVITELLQIPLNDLNIKATRGEKLGFIGNEEGIACEAVVLLIKK